MKKLSIFILAGFATLSAYCQQYKAEAPLPNIDHDGFYRIPLPPAISAYANSEFSNIRILNSEKSEVPYISGTDEKRHAGTTFLNYAIEQKTLLKDSCTVLVFANPRKSIINNISIVIKNAAVVKQASLAGSDDKQTWYALKDEFSMGFIDNPNGTSEIQIVDFPNSNYPYYRIIIDDKTSLPLNILNIGYYTTFSEDAKYYPVKTQRLSQTNNSTSKKSRVFIKFDTTHFIDKISWTVSGAPFFLRPATLYTERTSVNKQGKQETYLDYLADTELNSRQENVIFLPSVKTNNLILEISNDDNPPLTVTEANASQLARHLTAWLSSKSQYTLKFGDASMSAPVYDLEYFRDSIPSNPMVIQADAVHTLEAQASQNGEQTFFTSRLFIWGAILAVGLFLAFMSIKMVRETNLQRKQEG